MKRGTPQHPKTIMLANELKIPRYAAVGALESLWHFVSENVPTGAIGSYSNAHIAAAIDWKGKPDRLIKALVKTGWLDAHDTHRLIVHDWSDHCEDRVKMHLLRVSKHFADGSEPSTTRIAPAERAQLLEKLRGARVHTVSTAHTQPNPIPNPVPEPIPIPSNGDGDGGRANASQIGMGMGGNNGRDEARKLKVFEMLQRLEISAARELSESPQITEEVVRQQLDQVRLSKPRDQRAALVGRLRSIIE